LLTDEALVAGIAVRKATKIEFDRMAPQVVDPEATAWVTRGGNFAVAVNGRFGSSRNCRT
jgi:hypothetical protein